MGFERALRTRETTSQERIAAQKRLQALHVDLQAARAGTYLGDNYNDVPSSYQRARELDVRVEEAKGALDGVSEKITTIMAQLAAEQVRLAARSAARLTTPIAGNLWTASVASGEYVRKGQELATIVDCSSASVTAAVSTRTYNDLRLGDAVRFRVAGTSREYGGRNHQTRPHRDGIDLRDPAGRTESPDRRQPPGSDGQLRREVRNGRTGELVFEGKGLTARIAELLRRYVGIS